MYNAKLSVPEAVKTTLQGMNLMDRFLFDEAVEDPEVYNAMVEIIMENEVVLVKTSETEKELRVSPQLRQVRLDVIGTDQAGNVYQMEMQKRNTYNLPKRSRYYQAQIDVTLLDPGSKNFNNLNDVTTILVAPFDIFGYGLYQYTFQEFCEEVPDLRLNDGAKRIFINTKGKNTSGFSREFLDFMDYINSTTDENAEKTESEKIKIIHSRVKKIKASEKMGVKLMQKWEELAYAREDGWNEGKIEGKIEEKIDLICKKLIKGKTVEQIADDLEDTVENIAVICEVANEFAPDYDIEKICMAFQKDDTL